MRKDKHLLIGYKREIKYIEHGKLMEDCTTVENTQFEILIVI